MLHHQHQHQHQHQRESEFALASRHSCASRGSEGNPSVLSSRSDEFVPTQQKSDYFIYLVQFSRQNRTLFIFFLCISLINILIAMHFILVIIVNSDNSLLMTDYSRLLSWLIHESIPFLVGFNVYHDVHHEFQNNTQSLSQSPPSQSCSFDQHYNYNFLKSKKNLFLASICCILLPLITFSSIVYWYPLFLAHLENKLAVIAATLYSILYLFTHSLKLLMIFDLICGLEGCLSMPDTFISSCVQEEDVEGSFGSSADIVFENYTELFKTLDTVLVKHWKSTYAALFVIMSTETLLRLFSVVLIRNSYNEHQYVGGILYLCLSSVLFSTLFTRIDRVANISKFIFRRVSWCNSKGVFRIGSSTRHQLLNLFEKQEYGIIIFGKSLRLTRTMLTTIFRIVLSGYIALILRAMLVLNF